MKPDGKQVLRVGNLPTRVAFIAGAGAFLSGMVMCSLDIALDPHQATFTGLAKHWLIDLGVSSLIGMGAFFGVRELMRPIDETAKALRHAKIGEGAEVSKHAACVSPALGEAILEMTGKYDAVIKKSRIMAITDSLTGLANRPHFVKKLDAYIASAGERNVAVIILDLDRFSQINDKFGPEKADYLLTLVGQRFKTVLQRHDVEFRGAQQSQSAPSLIGRLGADVFAILLPSASQKMVETVAMELQNALQEPFLLESRAVDVTARFASAIAPSDAQHAVELMKRADLSLKAAKKNKAKKIVFFDSSLQDAAQRELALEDEIRRGLANHEFIPVFQPKIHLETGKVIGAEALARWRRPDGSVVSPGVFVPKMEDMGLVGQLGISILRDACMEAARWNFEGIRPKIAVNVSPLQFEDPNFVNKVKSVLNESGLAPERLELELTETAAVENPERVSKTMRPLRAQGVRFAIDDFGTGHSNFTTVTRLPFDVFKIDQQFVRAHGTDPHAPAIIEMILAMAEALDQETVAEGVETEAHYDFLRRRACTIGQGYYFSPPLPAHEFEAFVRQWRAPSLTKKLA